MPLMSCSDGGKSGWKYGNSGHCYTGPGAKKKAIKQGVAESYNGGHKFESRGFDDWLKAENMTRDDLESILPELDTVSFIALALILQKPPESA